MKRILLLTIAAAVFNINSYSADYYFSNSGNDELNTGRSELSPYKTINKLNTLTLGPGDRIFFQRGGSFQGQINLNSSGTSTALITFNAYGLGDNPLISGTIKVIGWKKYSGNIYVADIPKVENKVTQLFANGSLMTLARYPNEGFLKIDSAVGKTSLSSNALTQASGYWTGATLTTRTERWVYESRPVTHHVNETLLLSTPMEFNFKIGFGFYLSNKLSMIDNPGEWYHDATQNKIYFMPANLADPNNLNIEASVYNYGFNINAQNFISIDNLTLCYQGLDGIYINKCNSIFISNNIFSYNYRNGIWSGYQKGSNIKVVNNKFSDIGNNGIDISNSIYSIILGNTLSRIALIPGIGRTGFGIHAGPKSKVNYNKLESIGYNGIHCHTGDTVTYNNIKNTCLTMDDGAAIYFYKSDHIMIKNNIIINSIGNGISTPKEYSTFSHGIYLDDSSSYCTIQNNTVVNADYGIYLHNAFNNTIEKNTLYNNRKSQITLQNDRPYGKDIKQNVFLENIFFSLHPNQYSLTLLNYRSDIREFGFFDKNYFCNPYSEVLIKSKNVPGFPLGTVSRIQDFTLSSWKLATGFDVNSRTISEKFKFFNTTVNSNNLITNPSFTYGTKDWNKWGSPGYFIIADSTNKAMIGNALKSSFSTSGLNLVGNFASGNFSVSSGKFYQLTFKASSLKSSNINFDLTKNSHPYTSVDVNKNFLIGKEPKNYEYIFEANTSIVNTRVQFNLTGYDTTIWLDDVQLIEVSVDTNQSTPCKNFPILINNTSSTKSFRIISGFKDLYGNLISRRVYVSPYSSKIILKSSSSLINLFTEETQNLRQATSTDPSSDFKVFNIPAEKGDIIYIQYPQTGDFQNIKYVITDMKGREVLKGQETSDQADIIAIPTNDLFRGIFILYLVSGSITKTTKIVIN